MAKKVTKKDDKKMVLIILMAVFVPVVLVISVLAIVVIIGMVGSSERKAAESSCAIEYQTEAEKAIVSYQKENGKYPTTLDSIPAKNFPNKADYTFCASALNYSVSDTTYSLTIK